MEENEEFYQDMREGLIKAGQILKYLLETLTFKAGRDKEKNHNKDYNVILQKELTLKSNIKNLYHRADGRWEYSKVQNGNRIYFITKTKSEALVKIQNIRELQKANKIKESQDTVVGWARFWLKTYKKNIDTLNYKNIIEHYFTVYFKNMPLKKLTAIAIQQFLNTLTDKPRILDYAFITINQMLKQAFINNKINGNLIGVVSKPRASVKKKKKTALSLAEQIRFCEVLKNYDQDVQIFMMFSIICGTRRTETFKFDMSDLDEENKKIHIHGTKTENADRKIKISDEMINLLKTKNTKPYFTRQPHRYSEYASEILLKAKIYNKSLHDLRHTCSTNLHYLGWQDVERQHYLGHASIVMTNDIYTNLQDDITKEGLIKLYNNLYLKF